MRSRLVVLLLAVTMVAAACGSSSSPDTATRALDGSAANLPGVQAFGLTDAEFAANVETTEKLISLCMNEAGFEYVPVDVTAFLAVEDWLRADPTKSRLEFKTLWGYGISTRSDFPARDVGLGPQNLRIYADLPPADQAAYDRTLFGDDTDATFAITIDDEDFTSTGGCTKKAIDEVFPEEMRTGTFVNPKDVLVESDPRVQLAEQQWIDCMSEEGYEYLDQDEIIDEYEEQYDIIVGDDDPDELTGTRLDALTELQADEIAVALRDLECQAPVDEAVRTVEVEIFGAPVSG
ncbi:MAG: hypothetical protein HKO03_08195 [Acidimicrobiia bacterium]|nr:hypothetical protein [Acidimicrobiia bacterium]